MRELRVSISQVLLDLLFIPEGIDHRNRESNQMLYSDLTEETLSATSETLDVSQISDDNIPSHGSIALYAPRCKQTLIARE